VDECTLHPDLEAVITITSQSDTENVYKTVSYCGECMFLLFFKYTLHYIRANYFVPEGLDTIATAIQEAQSGREYDVKKDCPICGNNYLRRCYCYDERTMAMLKT